jgi:hypothetical protein
LVKKGEIMLLFCEWFKDQPDPSNQCLVEHGSDFSLLVDPQSLHACVFDGQEKIWASTACGFDGDDFDFIPHCDFDVEKTC